MRVLMLSKACIVGIYQRKLEEMAKHPGLELRVVVPPSWRDERGDIPLERAFVEGYELVVTPIRFNGNYHLHYYPRFAQHVADFCPDIIHIDEEPYNLATWLALRVAKRACVRTLFFSWQNIARYYPFPFRYMEKVALRSVDYAIVGTESAATVWRQKGYTGKLAIVPQFGVDPDLFTPPQQPRNSNPVKIGYAGRLWIGKGVDLLLEALATLRHYDWQLDIIGSGPEQAMLENQTRQLNLSERVTFTPWVPSTQMPAYMRSLDILAVPSRTLNSWKEQYGRVIIEAMASGVAVIGSDSGAIPDVIGDAGLIFPEGNCAALAEQLRRLIEDVAFRQSLGQQGRARVLAHFTQQQVATATIAVYKDLLRS